MWLLPHAPLRTAPHKMEIFWTVVSSTSNDGSFFSVAMTTPSVALMPRLVTPAATAASAYSICTSFPCPCHVQGGLQALNLVNPSKS